MKDFFDLIDRNVQDITYDLLGIIFPGLITIMYIYFSQSISILQIENSILVNRYYGLNNGIKLAIIFLLAYLIGLIFHGVYIKLFKESERQIGIEVDLKKYFKLCKNEEFKKLIVYGTNENIEMSFEKQSRTALHILQRKSKNKYLSKYLAKRVMYRTLMILCFSIIIVNIVISLYLIFVLKIFGMSLIKSLIEVLLSYSLIYIFKDQIQRYTKRILKELKLGIALLE